MRGARLATGQQARMDLPGSKGGESGVSEREKEMRLFHAAWGDGRGGVRGSNRVGNTGPSSKEKRILVCMGVGTALYRDIVRRDIPCFSVPFPREKVFDVSDLEASHTLRPR